MNIPGYEVGRLIHGGSRYSIHEGRRVADDLPVAIKMAAAAALEWEYELTRSLPIRGVVRVDELVLLDEGGALILEHTGALPLRTLLDDGRLNRDGALDVAIRLSSILVEVHRHGVVHGAVRPDSVLVHPETGQVWLTCFDAASRLPGERPRTGPVDLAPEALAYTSPEQTGRLNRRVGHRADLYAFGVLLYEMLTGQVPFWANDPLELIHKHIAQAPAPPLQVRPGVPHVLSDITMKLLAKAAEDRYRGAQGVQADLTAYRSGDAGPGFVPGRQDPSNRIRIPEKLYGRAHELDVVMSAFDRVSEGEAEFLLVSGYSGIGKSALVSEVHRPIARQRGYFVAGKFDQFKRNIPHSAIISAFQDLARQLLTETTVQVERWRERLQSALGDNGQVIVQVIPEIELIIGRQPPVPQLPPAETKNRFNLVFERFIKVFAQKEHPLVVFLDDLQWADAATLEMLQALATDRTLRHLLILGAYRDNEVSAGHPLLHTISSIEKSGTTVGQIQLAALSLKDLQQFTADTLDWSVHQAAPLAELILEKTGGNPFFVIQFVKLLHAEGLLSVDERQGAWRCDLGGIRSMGITDNVVDLMLHKIRRLPEATQNVVKLAACVGNTFDLHTLAVVYQDSPERSAADLRVAVHEGAIVPVSETSHRIAEFRDPSITKPESALYKFLHDRVQQAAYRLIPDEDKRLVHLRAGRLLWEHSDESRLEEQLFEIVGHLNKGAALIVDADERNGLAQLNLRAGRKAKTATAYEPALTYFEQGISILGEDPWTTQYSLAFALHLERAECSYLCGEFEQAEQALEGLLQRAASPLDKAEIYRIRMVQYENTSRFPEARDWGKTGLALFGIVFPEDDTERQAFLQAEMASIDRLIDGRPIARLVDLPVMTDARMRISMKLLMTMWAPAYISGDMMLTTLVAAKMVHLSLRYGNVEESAYGYVTYAATVGLRRADYTSSYAFGRLALAVNERFDDLTARAKVNHMFSCYIGFWREPIAACFPYSREAYRAGMSSGDFIYAAYGAFHECWHALFSGQQLDELQRQYAAYLEFMSKTKNQTFYDAHQLTLHWARALAGGTDDPCSLNSDDFDEERHLEKLGALRFFVSFYSVAKLQLYYLFEDYERAAEMADRAAELAPSTEGMIWDAWRCFYRALTLAARCRSVKPSIGEATVEELDTLSARLAVWAENSPANFSHRHQLVVAEIAASRGHVAGAIDAYEMAIALAAEHGFTQIEALANERYARFWLERGNERVARLYMSTAQRRYAKWGAKAKVSQLATRFPELVAPLSLGSAQSLDLATVMRAAQVISGEVDRRRLLDKLLRIVMENAGAQRGLLVLGRDDDLLVEAEGTIEQDSSAVRSPIAIDRCQRLASSIVHYVARVAETVVLADATREPRFSMDPYILRHRPRSLLCTPILHRGNAIGVLYLENNLVRDAFTPDRIEVVGLLAAQAAISLQNARLYNEARQEVAERKQIEKALKKAHDELELRVAERTDELSRANLRLEREISEHGDAKVKLQQALEYAESANRAKSEFLANMSHELRTPLNAILGYTQIFRRDVRLTETQRNGIGIIERSGEHLLTLINDILSLSKIEAGKLEPVRTDFDLTPFLEDVTGIARVRAEQRGLAFVYEALTPLPDALRGDERLIRQVLLNLLGNAIKFTDRGGVVLRTSYDAKVGLLRFEVEDTGIGIPADKLGEMFEPFCQVHGADRNEEGTGLGLAITRKLIDLMGGRINVQSTPAKGSVFGVELPLSAHAPARIVSRGRQVTGFAGAALRVLVVDDRVENRNVLIELLAPLGFEVLEAENGRDALAKVKSWHPQLVLMDLVMPVLDGFEAARRIRQMPGMDDVVILALSASVFEHNRQQSAEAGCHDFIPKPIQAGLLFEKMGEHLGLEWTYSDEEASPARAREERPEVGREHEGLVTPPAATLATLQRLAMTGDVQGVLQELEDMERTEVLHGPFLAAVRRMATDYDMQRISEFISLHLEGAHEPDAE